MNPSEASTIYVGIDWATQAHRVVVLDTTRAVVADRVVPHTGPALAALADDLTREAGGEVGRVAIAIEVPRGPVVETLLERGFAVFALNPKQLDRFRDRYSLAGAKDDRRDGQVLAHALATDPAAFRRLEPEAAAVIRLRELGRAEADLQEELTRGANRLRDHLLRCAPHLLALCPAADEPWFWAVVELALSPADAPRGTRADVATLLQRHRIRRVTPEVVLAALQTPPLRVTPGTVEAVGERIAWLLPQLQLLHRHRRECARRVEQALAAWEATPGPGREQRDVTILRSLPGVGRVVAATLLADAAPALRARDYHALRAQSGLAPVTRQSGKSRGVTMRRACHRRLRTAMYHWGRVSVQRDALSRQHYTALRARGHRHARALRGVVDRLLTVLIAMLKTQRCYDPSRRRAFVPPAVAHPA